MIFKKRADTDAELLMAEKRIKWEKVAASYSAVDWPASLDNHARIRVPLDAELVLRYKNALVRGDVFPHSVWMQYRKPNEHKGLLFKILGGINRGQAEIELGATESEVYLVQETSQMISDILPRQLNLLHGQVTSPDDRADHGIYFREYYDLSLRAAAEMAKMPWQRLGEEIRYRDVKLQLEKEGICFDANAGKDRKVVLKLATIKNKKVRLETARLVTGTGVATNVVDSLVSTINKTTESEAAMLKVLEEHRISIEQEALLLKRKGKGPTPALESQWKSLLGKMENFIKGKTSFTQFHVTDHAALQEYKQRGLALSRDIAKLSVGHEATT